MDIYAGSVFLYEAIGWNIYLSSACILAITAVYTMLGKICCAVCLWVCVWEGGVCVCVPFSGYEKLTKYQNVQLYIIPI